MVSGWQMGWVLFTVDRFWVVDVNWVIFTVIEIWVEDVGRIVSRVFIVDSFKKNQKKIDKAKNIPLSATSLSKQPQKLMCNNYFTILWYRHVGGNVSLGVVFEV